MRLSFITCLLPCLILIGCQDEEELQIARGQLTVTRFRLVLANAKAENDLITKIVSSEQSYTLSFEESASATLARKNVDEISYDSARWLLTFVFHDGTMQSAYFVGQLDFAKADVEVNPYLTTPLTALVQMTTPVKGKFRVVVQGKPSSGISVAKEFGAITNDHRLSILGLYEDYENLVELMFLSPRGKVRCSKTINIKTAPIEERPPLEIETLRNDLPQVYEGVFMISNLNAGFDQTGQLRWLYNDARGSFFGKLRNGNFILAAADNSVFYEVTMLGQRVKEYAVPNGLHHEIAEMTNGNFLVAAYSPPGPPLEDRLVEISRVTGAVVKVWDLKTILDPTRKTLPGVARGDWLHINAAYYDDSDHTIVISGRSQCAVVKFDYESGAIRWILGNHNDWKPSYASYLLKPVDAAGNPIDPAKTDFWSYGQHSIHRLPNGDILLYDNGDYRGFYDDPNVPSESYTRIAEYRINENDMTVQLTWQFTNNKTLFTRFTGSTQFLGEKRLAGYMAISEETPRIVEVNIDGEVLYDAVINRNKAFYYRASKVDLYAGMD